MSLPAQIINVYKQSFTGLSRETWLLSTVILINRCGYMAVPFMGLYVTQSLHRSAYDAGVIITLFGIGSILGTTTGGKLTDVIGFRPVQIFASIIGGILFLLFAFTEYFPTLCVLSVVISFFSDAFRPANFVAIAAYASPGSETRSYSLNRLAVNLGWAVGASIGGIIASFDYKLLFIVDGLVNILAGLSIVWFLPKVKEFRKTVKERTKNIVVRKPWQDTVYVKFILLCTVFIICFFLMFRVVPVFFKEEWKIDEATIGLILGFNGLFIALFEMVMIAKIENRRTPMFYIIVGVLLTGVSFLLLMLPISAPILVGMLVITLFTFGEMFSLPFINTFVISRSNEFNRGLYAAGYTLSWSVAQVIGPTAGFFIAERYGYNVLWIALTLMLIVCAVAFNSLKSGKEMAISQ